MSIDNQFISFHPDYLLVDMVYLKKITSSLYKETYKEK